MSLMFIRGGVAEHHWGKYATFVSFFPQLVAGPIERTGNLLPQIKAEREFDYELASYGLKQMAWGYFKKLVIADTISQYTGNVFDAPQNFHGLPLILAAMLFTIQIYCDFSGYSDIATGAARLFGIKLMMNFKSPYFSQGIKEFWSRWHISLSAWFKDYVYIPLGGSRSGKLRSAVNLLLTFLLSGLWHGANWTFVAWGGLQGIALILENSMLPKKYRTSTGIVWLLRVLLVFLFCSFSWIFFASNSLNDAMYIVGHMFDGILNPIVYLHEGFSMVKNNWSKITMFFLAISLSVLFIFDYLSTKMDVIAVISSKKKTVRWMIYHALALWIVFHIPVMTATEFIYFQF